MMFDLIAQVQGGYDVRFWLPMVIAVVSIIMTTLTSRNNSRTAESLGKITDAVRKFERLEDRTNETIDTLETKLHSNTEKLVDARMQAMSHQFGQHAQIAVGQIEELKGKIREADLQLRGLLSADHELENKILARVDQFKDVVRKDAATKEDVKGHEDSMNRRLDRVQEQIGRLDTTVAVLASRIENSSAHMSPKRGGA